MNKYVVAIYRYFNGYHNFTVEATNKADALEKAKEEARRYGSGNYNINDSKVVKKLQKGK